MSANLSLLPGALRDADAAELGRLETPCYVLDPALVMEDHAALRQALGTALIVSMKANPVLDLLVRCNQAFGDGIEIASLGELNVTVGRMTVPRYVNTPALDATLAAAALACRATIICDSAQQVALVRQAAARARGPVRIGLRLNAGSLLGSGPAQSDHFGMDASAMWDLLDNLPEGPVQVVGLHSFAGSNSFTASGAALASRMSELVAEFTRRRGTAPSFVTLGAGLPSTWREAGIEFAAYRASLAPLQRQTTVLHEAGRAVFSRGGAFLTRVVGVKPLADHQVAVCDGGMAQCFALAQTENFVKRVRVPRVVRASSASPAAGAAAMPDVMPTLVVGNSCNRADVIGRLDGPAVQDGDILVFDHCGAYHSYSPSGFLNLRPAQFYIAA